MKTKTLLFVILGLMPLFAGAQQYCEPPSFLTGPYTGIINVSLDGTPALNNSTVYNEGYYYYSALGATAVEVGAQYTISVTTQDDIAYGQNTRVWIDWNSDKDFDDAGELAAAWNEHVAGVLTKQITVPTGATLGITRMRVYTDMTTSMGHITPEPCGYMNHQSHSLGHHGGIEDYDLNIQSSTGIGDRKQIDQFEVYYHINNDIIEVQYNLLSASTVSVEVYNMIGQQTFSEPSKIQPEGDHIYNLKFNDFETEQGIYIINLIVNGRPNSFKIAVLK